MTLAWAVVFLSAAWVGYAYLGYPLLLSLLARIAPRPRVASEGPPAALSVIIAVHNGAHALERKLDQTLALAYPRGFEVIVVSDGSTDETDAVAEDAADRGVLLIRNDERQGKEAAQGLGVARATGEVLVFTDVTAELSADALQEIARPFADPSIGCVSSEDEVEDPGGEGTYVRLEMALRRWESEATTLVGLSGSFFAVRRELCSPWVPDLASDFRLALEASRRGLRAVSEPRARASFRAVDDPSAEWRRKVRTVRRGIAVLLAYRELLHPRYGRAAFSLWGHKLARFTAPFALLVLLGASAVVAGTSPAGALLFAAQVAAYAVGGLSLAAPHVVRFGLARLAGFFMLVNASMLVAWGYHVSGRRAVAWDPTRR